MISLVITANDELYERFDRRTRADGNTSLRAKDVLDGYRQAKMLGLDATIVVDMSLPTADTLVEALHSRQATAHIPLLAIQCDQRPLPLGVRRLCVGVIEPDTLRPVEPL
jgi:hypothetical protein